MTVRELRRLLENQDPSALVVLSADAEGNHMSPCGGIEAATYVGRSPWSGECYLPELTPELEAQGYTAEDVRTVESGAENALVLYPMN